MSRQGFSIVELVVVVAIISTLLMIAAFAYVEYNVRYNIERQTKEMYSNLMKARMRAFQENRQIVVVFNTNSYASYIDNDSSGSYTTGDILIPDLTDNNLAYPLAYTFNEVVFDFRGLANRAGYIRIDRDNQAEYDCINVNFTRIDMGKYNGANCVNK